MKIFILFYIKFIIKKENKKNKKNNIFFNIFIYFLMKFYEYIQIYRYIIIEYITIFRTTFFKWTIYKEIKSIFLFRFYVNILYPIFLRYTVYVYKFLLNYRIT